MEQNLYLRLHPRNWLMSKCYILFAANKQTRSWLFPWKILGVKRKESRMKQKTSGSGMVTGWLFRTVLSWVKGLDTQCNQSLYTCCPQIVCDHWQVTLLNHGIPNHWNINLLVMNAQHTLIGVWYTSLPLLKNVRRLLLWGWDWRSLDWRKSGTFGDTGAALKEEEIKICTSTLTLVWFLKFAPRTLAAKCILCW